MTVALEKNVDGEIILEKDGNDGFPRPIVLTKMLERFVSQSGHGKRIFNRAL